MKKPTKKQLTGGGLLLTAGLAFTACPAPDNKPTPPTCKCPEGTTHKPGETCCEDPNCPCPEEKGPEVAVDVPKDLSLGDIKITLNYKKKPSEQEPAYIARIQDRLNTMAIIADPTHPDYNQATALLVNNLTDRDGDYSINVVYDGMSFDAFKAVDGQTLEAHDSWLTDNATTISNAQLRTGFNAMLAMPLAMLYDRATNTIFITLAEQRATLTM